MKKLFSVLGVIVYILVLLSTALTGGAVGFFVGLAAAVIPSAIFFGIAAILEGQDNILSELDGIRRRSTADSIRINGKTVCPSCKKEYDPDYSSCPYCGFKA